LPLCSCGVIPTGVSFYKNGASKGSSVSFLISTPQTGVDSIMVTYSLLGLPLAVLRPVIALFTGIAGGVLTNYMDTKKDIEPKIEEKTVPNFAEGLTLNLGESAKSNSDSTCSDSSCDCHNEESPKGNKIQKFFKYAFIDFMQDIAVWLIIGLGIAALISVIVPDDFFQSYIGNNFLSMLIVLAASVPLYVCATGSVPIAAMLIVKGLSPGAAIAFLMAGPATNAATITVISKSMGRKALSAYLISIIGGAIIFGSLIDVFMPAHILIPDFVLHQHEHEVLPMWLHYMSTIVLGILALNAILMKYNVYSFSKKEEKMSTLTVSVHGMTCNHCKMNVEKNVMKLSGVNSAVVNLTSKIVTIDGDVSLNELEKTINDLGYEYKGKVE